MDEELHISRRGFLKGMIGTFGLVAGGSGLAGLVTNLLKLKEEPTSFKNEDEKRIAMESTQSAPKNQEDLKTVGIPEQAINSSVKIEFTYGGSSLTSSGTIGITNFENDDYWILVTSGHSYLMNPLPYDTLIISKESPQPNPGKVVSNQFGVHAVHDTQTKIDLALVVIPKKLNPQLEQIIPSDKALKQSNLRLNLPPNPLDGYFNVNYSTTGLEKPSYGVKMHLDPLTYTDNDNESILNPIILRFKNNIVFPGASGSGVFASNGDLVGVLIQDFSYDDPFRSQSVNVLNLSALGQDVFDNYLAQAVADFKSKQTAKP